MSFKNYTLKDYVIRFIIGVSIAVTAYLIVLVVEHLLDNATPQENTLTERNSESLTNSYYGEIENDYPHEASIVRWIIGDKFDALSMDSAMYAWGGATDNRGNYYATGVTL